jgi:hypothetical protein
MAREKADSMAGLYRLSAISLVSYPVPSREGSRFFHTTFSFIQSSEDAFPEINGGGSTR